MPHVTTFRPPTRLLLGPGPCNVHDRILESMRRPLVSHVDPCLSDVKREIRRMLRTSFGTANDATLALTGTGMAGMEAVLVNALPVGSHAVIGVHGAFGERMVNIAKRCGATPFRVDAP